MKLATHRRNHRVSVWGWEGASHVTCSKVKTRNACRAKKKKEGAWRMAKCALVPALHAAEGLSTTQSCVFVSARDREVIVVIDPLPINQAGAWRARRQQRRLGRRFCLSVSCTACEEASLWCVVARCEWYGVCNGQRKQRSSTHTGHMMTLRQRQRSVRFTLVQVARRWLRVVRRARIDERIHPRKKSRGEKHSCRALLGGCLCRSHPYHATSEVTRQSLATTPLLRASRQE